MEGHGKGGGVTIVRKLVSGTRTPVLKSRGRPVSNVLEGVGS